MADVQLGVHTKQVPRRSRASTGTNVFRPPLLHVRVMRDARGETIKHPVEILRVAPQPFTLVRNGEALLERHRPWVVVSASKRRRRAIQDCGSDPLGIRRSEEHGHWATFRNSHDCSAPRVRRIHDRAQIIHPRFEVWDTRHAIGQAGPALVEDDESGERREPAEEVARRAVPRAFEGREYRSDYENKVERPIANDPVGDVDPATLRIADLRCLHGR